MGGLSLALNEDHPTVDLQLTRTQRTARDLQARIVAAKPLPCPTLPWPSAEELARGSLGPPRPVAPQGTLRIHRTAGTRRRRADAQSVLDRLSAICSTDYLVSARDLTILTAKSTMAGSDAKLR